MCIALPMRVIDPEGDFALVAGRGETRRVSLLLIGPQAAGTPLLIHAGTALRVLDEAEVPLLERALDAVQAVAEGRSPDGCFEDLENRTPQLPAHLLARPPSVGEQLVAAYEAAARRTRSLPIFNPALRVEAVGFRHFEGGQIGVVITPWFMNLVFVPGPEASAPGRVGETRRHGLPAGPCELLGAWLDGIGAIEACSLFSPMGEFSTPEGARATAEQALETLFTPVAEESSSRSSRPSRRELFSRIVPR